VEAVKRLTADTYVPVIDLHARSIELAERLGPAAWPDLSPRNANGSVDTTHLNAQGSLDIARLVADALREVVPELAAHVRSAER
jgi:lysophospholipase L1-like esterase